MSVVEEDTIAIQKQRGVCVIEKNGVELVHVDGCASGLKLVATRDIGPYELILHEKPCLEWEPGTEGKPDLTSIVEEFLKVDEDRQDAILSAGSNEVPEVLKSEIPKLSQEYGHLLGPDADQKIEKLVSIVMAAFNSPFRCFPNDPSSTTTDTEKDRFFLYGVTASQSCSPNARCMPPDEEDQSVKLRTTRKVTQGEEITVSVIGNLLLYETPTYMRQEFMRRILGPEFVCKCDRCMEPDYCRMAPCPECQDIVPCANSRDMESRDWCCPQCGIQDEVTESEGQFWMFLGDLSSDSEPQTNDSFLTYMFDESKQYVAQSHFLRNLIHKRHIELATGKADAEELMIQLFYSDDHSAQQQAWKYRESAVMAGLFRIAQNECAAHKCHGCGLTIGHGIALYEVAEIVYQICQNLLKLPRYIYPATAQQTVRKYFKVLQDIYGENHEDIVKFREIIGMNVSPNAGVGKGVGKGGKGGSTYSQKNKKKNRKKRR